MNCETSGWEKAIWVSLQREVTRICLATGLKPFCKGASNTPEGFAAGLNDANVHGPKGEKWTPALVFGRVGAAWCIGVRSKTPRFAAGPEIKHAKRENPTLRS